MRNSPITIVFSSVVLIVLIWLFLTQFMHRNNDIESIISPQVNFSIDGDRKWRQADWNQNDLDYSADIFNPVLLTSYKDKIYLGDWGDMSVKILSADGQLLKAIGEQGRGPGEFQRIMDINFNDELIFISDPEKHEVIIYSIEGDYSHSFKLEYPSYRSAISDHHVFTLALQDSLFGIYTHEGIQVGKFGKIMDDPIMNRISLSGRIHYIESNDLMLFIPRMASFLYYYSDLGNLYQITKTLDKIPFTPANRETSGTQIRIRPPDQEVQIMDFFLKEEQLYLLGRFMKGGSSLDDEYFIDVYHIQGEEYFYSFHLPVPAHQFTIVDDKFFFIDLTDQSLVSYDMIFKN